MDDSSLVTFLRHRYFIAAAAALLLIITMLALTACGRAKLPGPSPVPSTRTPEPTSIAPTGTATATAVVRAHPSQTPAPEEVAEQIAEETTTATAVPVNTPEAGPDAYRLKPWDQDTALRTLADAGIVPIPEEYADLREFYRVSLLSEVWLNFPDLRENPNLIKQMAELKGLNSTYFASYGLLHDHSVEPFRLLLEQALNNGISFLSLNRWVEVQGAWWDESIVESTRLFDQTTPARVIKVTGNAGWDFFIIRTEASGRYSVLALYPEWRRYWWSDETFQLTDLNANGRDEIAVTHDDWGTGSSRFCQKSFKLYEWDGSAFRDRMADQLEVYMGTEYGDCLEITFPLDQNGRQLIQAGTELNTLCPEAPYREIVTFYWNGAGYKQSPASLPTPPQAEHPNRCTIDWALKAGPDNDSAVKLLAAALWDWPEEANQEWGPAAQDYFRLKLAAWSIQRGDIAHGLALVKQVRDHPAAPAYPLPARVAAVFLDAYAKQGFYRAAQEVDKLYEAELVPFCGECLYGPGAEILRQEWGFAEMEWGFGYGNYYPEDFMLIRPLTLTIQQNHPTSLKELHTLLEDNQLHPVWSIQGDLDGQGNEDWLVEIEEDRQDYLRHRLYAFLRQGNRTIPVHLSDFYLLDEISATDTRRWQGFTPEPGGPRINVFQVGPRLYAFHFIQKQGEIEVETDLNSWIITYGEEENRVRVEDWKVEADRLVVQYDGREAVYLWNETEGKLVPTAYAPELQEQHIRDAEQALYFDHDPELALTIINTLLSARIYEDYAWSSGVGVTNPARLRPYLLYLLGLTHEQSGDEANAVQAYWQLWHDFPAFPYSLAAQSKLERR